jgi:hypothetical protein
MEAQTISLAIGDMVWGIQVVGLPPPAWPSAYTPFIGPRAPTQRLTVRPGEGAPHGLAIPIFETDATWSLYQTSTDYILIMPGGRIRQSLRQWARLSDDFQSAELFTSDLTDLTRLYPFDQLWSLHLLSGLNGLLCHGCGVDYQGRGMLFLGHSGEGKTTMAGLWAKVPGATILSDERIIVRKTDEGYQLYGTPWHGQGRFAAPSVVSLKHIFVLSHGPTNCLSPLTGSSAVAAVLARSLAPYWHQTLMDGSLRAVAGLCQAHQIERLEFIPDHRVISLLQGLG